MGVDAPHVPLAWWRAGAAALGQGVDVVLGPADDGGYWAIGVRTPQPALFAEIAWGTSTVYAATCDRIARLGVSLARLPSTFDVDEPDDLERLRAALTATPDLLPATTRVLASLPR